MDPVCKSIPEVFNSKVLLVEPVPEVAERLSLRYSNKSNVKIKVCAVGSKKETRILWTVSDEAKNTLGSSLPLWWDNISSFNSDHIDIHLGGALAEFKKAIEVDVITPGDLLSSEDISSVCVLHIDAEGADLEILDAWPLHSIRPEIILIEHIHLNRNDKQSLVALLKGNGYRAQEFRKDYLAIKLNSKGEYSI